MGYTDTNVVVTSWLSIRCTDEVVDTFFPVVTSTIDDGGACCSKDDVDALDVVTTFLVGGFGELIVVDVLVLLYLDAITFEHGRQFEMT